VEIDLDIKRITEISDNNKEIGGQVVYDKGKFLLNDLPNFSRNKKRFISEIDVSDLYKEELKGFWHTHPLYSFPSPPDFWQMLKLNLKFRRNYMMVIIGKKRISITEFKYFVFPFIKFLKIKTV